MAYTLNYDGQGTGDSDNTVSDSFIPTASFGMKAYGDIKTNVVYTVEMISTEFPDNDSRWFTATGTKVTMDSSGSFATVNFFKGFKYRLKRSTNGNQDEALQFDYGHLTTEDWNFG